MDEAQAGVLPDAVAPAGAVGAPDAAVVEDVVAPADVARERADAARAGVAAVPVALAAAPDEAEVVVPAAVVAVLVARGGWAAELVDVIQVAARVLAARTFPAAPVVDAAGNLLADVDSQALVHCARVAVWLRAQPGRLSRREQVDSQRAYSR